MRTRIALAAVLALAPVALAQPQPFDLVIVNARLVDGSGAPARMSSLGIKDGRIAKVGGVTAAQGADVIDARGDVAAPGFVDVHSHADDVASRPDAANFVRMGVTTVVAGNCGSSALDIAAAFERMAEGGIAINVATLIGHNTVRSSVMGRAQRPPTAGELQKMKALVFKGMADGAVGFSTGLQYIPGTYATAAEITELARVAANEGGLYATHMRNEGTALLDAVRESIAIGSVLRMRVQISHLKVDSPSRWGSSADALALIDDARKRGIDV
jgi:N-acyl-D-amino-acid deacylase